VWPLWTNRADAAEQMRETDRVAHALGIAIVRMWRARRSTCSGSSIRLAGRTLGSNRFGDPWADTTTSAGRLMLIVLSGSPSSSET
jgi:hypothetical protein